MPPTDQADLRSHLPIKPIPFLILVSLSDQDRHGYGILRDVEETSAGEVKLDAGNLYRTLRRLLAAGLVIRSARRPVPDADDERRRYYRLSELGRLVLAAEARRMERLLRLDRVRSIAAEIPS